MMYRKADYLLLLLISLSLLFNYCSKKDDDPMTNNNHEEIGDWPESFTNILTFEWLDDTNDIILAPDGQPPFVYPFPPIDIERILMGVKDNYLYIKVEFAGTIPTEKVYIPAQNGITEQWVQNQGMSVNLNADGDTGTGASGEGILGIDIFFGLVFDYGNHSQAYANYGFPDGDIHNNLGHIDAVIGEGGQGFNFAIMRFNLSLIQSKYFPRGTTVDAGSWSEAESFDADGNKFYHHFAFDPQPSASFPIPN